MQSCCTNGAMMKPLLESFGSNHGQRSSTKGPSCPGTDGEVKSTSPADDDDDEASVPIPELQENVGTPRPTRSLGNKKRREGKKRHRNKNKK